MVLELFGFLTGLGGYIINATNCSSDNGFAKVKSRFRSEGMMPLVAIFCVAEASHSSTKGFSLRFVCCVACAPQSSTLGYESTTCALHAIRSVVSVLTRNRPWVTGEIQLAPKSFALPLGLCLSTVFSAN